jgi:large subunit ribosomal protein L17
MRHKVKGRKLGRNASHRKAMFRNMVCSLIRSVMVDEDDPGRPKNPGRIVTTIAKAKELRPKVEKLITLAKKALPHQERAQEFGTTAERNSDAWKSWRESEQWNQWNQAIAPAVALRRRAFSLLRDKQAVSILFDTIAPQYATRPGGYTRVVKLPNVRLGDAGVQALIEFVGDERDRAKSVRRSGPAPVVTHEPANTQTQPAETQPQSETPAEQSGEQSE